MAQTAIDCIPEVSGPVSTAAHHPGFHKRKQPQTPEQFVDEAEALPPDTPTPTSSYPWDGGRPDVFKSFNLRLPEPILFQLRYIGEHTPYSMQQFCIEHLTEAIQEKITELMGEQ